MTHVIAALDIAEDVILPALRLLGAAWWGVAPVTEQVVGRLHADAADPTHLRRAFIAQIQAAGGPAPLLNSAGWEGVITVKCLSADQALARAGRTAAHTKMLTLSAPTGYALSAKYTGPMPTFRDTDDVWHVGSVYAVTIRGAA